jgi:hypothetical protein
MSTTLALPGSVPESYRSLFTRLRVWLNEQPEVLSAEISADSVIANLATHDLIITLEEVQD